MVLHAKLRLEQNLYKVDGLLEFMMGLDCLYILSCHSAFQSKSTLYSSLEVKGVPCQKQALNLKFK